MLTKSLLAGAALLVATGAQAQTGTYTFSYVLTTGSTVSGSLKGSLLAGGNVFNITGLNGFFVNGVAATDGPMVDSTDRLYVQTNTTPSTTLDGSFIDFAIYSVIGSELNNILTFAVGDKAADGDNQVGATIAYGGDESAHAFALTNYEASFTSADAAVPEPATWGMMVLGFGLVGAGLRGRRQQARVTFG